MEDLLKEYLNSEIENISNDMKFIKKNMLMLNLSVDKTLTEMKDDINELKSSKRLNIKNLKQDEVFVNLDRIENDKDNKNHFFYNLLLNKDDVKSVYDNKIENRFDKLKIVEIKDDVDFTIKAFDKNKVDEYLFNYDPKHDYAKYPLNFCCIVLSKNNEGVKYDDNGVVRFWIGQTETLTTIGLYQEMPRLLRYYLNCNNVDIENVKDEELYEKVKKYFDDNNIKPQEFNNVEDAYNYFHNIVAVKNGKFSSLDVNSWANAANHINNVYHYYLIYYKDIIDNMGSFDNIIMYIGNDNNEYKYYVYGCNVRMYNAFIKYYPMTFTSNEINCKMFGVDNISQITINVDNKDLDIDFNLDKIIMEIRLWNERHPINEPSPFYIIFRVKQ